MKKMKKASFWALLFLFLSLGPNSSLLAQITYCLEFEAAADCNNATVDVYLVHDAPAPTETIDGVPYFYVAGNIPFTYDPVILSNPVLTDHGFWGTGFLSTVAGSDVLEFNFNPGDFIEYQFKQRVRVFTITFDHSTSLECLELAFNGQGTFPATNLHTTSNEVLAEGFLEVEYLCIPECSSNRLAVEINDAETSIPNTITVYPNPAVKDSDISLSLKNTIEGEREISVVDINGKVVFREKYSGEMLQIQLPSSQWNAGMYIVSSTNKSEKLTTRFIIK